MKVKLTLVIFCSCLSLLLLLGKATRAQNTFEQSGPYECLSKSLYLNDRKRNKSLEYVITYPNAQGKYPLIIWSHGAFGSSGIYSPLVNHWVSHGYICIQPTHEDSIKAYGRQHIRKSIQSARLNGQSGRQAFQAAFQSWKQKSFANWRSRPQDISLILDSLSKIEKTAQLKQVKCFLDKDSIAVGGHSFGAHTSQVIGGTTIGGSNKLMDERPKAILLISPQGRERGFTNKSSLNQSSWKDFNRPMMVITGTKDTGRNQQSYEWRTDPYRYSPPIDKFLLVINEADHGFGGITTARRNGKAVNPEHVKWVKAASLAFYDEYLKHSRKAELFLEPEQISKNSQGKVNLSTK